MTDLTFALLTTVTCDTKRAGAAGFAAHLSNLKCTPLFPVSAETQTRLDIQSPYKTFETFLQDNPDIKNGDLLVINTVEYEIKSAAPWAFAGDTRMHLVVEDTRN